MNRASAGRRQVGTYIHLWATSGGSTRTVTWHFRCCPKEAAHCHRGASRKFLRMRTGRSDEKTLLVNVAVGTTSVMSISMIRRNYITGPSWSDGSVDRYPLGRLCRTLAC